MQPTAIFTILALATAGLAAPAEQSVAVVAARTASTPSDYCKSTNDNKDAYCCNAKSRNDDIVTVLSCILSTGNTCSSGTVHCCDASGATTQGGLLAINALNCNNIGSLPGLSDLPLLGSLLGGLLG